MFINHFRRAAHLCWCSFVEVLLSDSVEVDVVELIWAANYCNDFDDYDHHDDYNYCGELVITMINMIMPDLTGYIHMLYTFFDLRCVFVLLPGMV